MVFNRILVGRKALNTAHRQYLACPLKVGIERKSKACDLHLRMVAIRKSILIVGEYSSYLSVAAAEK